jgi:hypothetical protein
MSYFKAADNSVHYLDDDSFAYLLPEGSTKMTDEQVADMLSTHINPPNPQIGINKAALEYLESTDWYVIRNQETGESIPAEVSRLRQEAREKIVPIQA